MTDETDTPMVRALDGECADRLDLEKVSKELTEGGSEPDGQECPQQ